ncbi:methyltransferase [Arthrobacter sp. ERGS1:01]|uniref:class I SAM-dependent DNA methyltransferase n=1 Tax=Arthrobacter sp. ERGS1:01 TaxID=1704044 RepID=UPI0006B46F83|nr:class I SAM-dependent methyltransferase [Arthrobacter sp. ERGS1:01]ALE06894.1 methyltransferase [Arthrobacter sp. ERGS1:01]
MDEPLDVTATRAAYDTVAASYEELLRDLMAEKVYDRVMVAAFSERVVGTGNVKVLDAGCGPGRITAHLASIGLDAAGMDLSPGMIEVARKAHPGLDFEVGTIEALDADPGSLGGIVAWYSLIHTPPERLPGVLDSFHAALAGGGFLLLAFQVGDAGRHIGSAYGHDVSYDAFLMDPERVTTMLEQAGFKLEAKLVRGPDRDEKTPQAYLIAQKRARP